MKNLYYKVGAGLSVLPTLALPLVARAAVSEGLSGAASDVSTIGGEIGVEPDLPTIVGSAINVLLGVLGIVFVVLVVYAGFLYLTSNGEEGNVKKAKKLLTQSVIGLIIIVAAYAIASYVISALTAISGA
ncbi:hypothetical protein A2348_02270 [Candidatus Uhrbacteria bacterium RIFOXYB12_FULL_58_10]|uniref:Uncharacterized protein n=1 Tax=Candidatus Uhrbacteria bacterium RIFOXYB2_FULL_57_15 TaxID=1802422 RepID=A0A1F7WA21_9BACT|nr:MAG: hypothetical protein A2348_02270 [Candidatus Uhrbacteria bacterium RIFOXYB12_FULL_58_10]OGL99629.1 MAG: hypothetical protein A2304_04475 [Candidatus Uhrbacteria bacterium RIFOXYB2_FULL_57_15]OGM00452.1 MAG: hypothetical protein A2501_00615 [Candidatus Uhrbacteria bacterium RIFOXYC12_FULL_57_11]